MIAASCPRCGSEAPPLAPRCEQCGFVFFEERERRRIGRPRPLPVALAVLALILAAGAVALLTRDGPAAAPAAPASVAQASGERRLESQFANAGYGDTQLILVGLDGSGELDITIPYPAQRRPGG